MAFAELKDVRMRYEVAGPEGAPALLFSNPLGTDLSVWDAQPWSSPRSIAWCGTTSADMDSLPRRPVLIPSSCYRAMSWRSSIF